MATTWNDVASQIIGTLRSTDPELDTSIGTTTRKIIDAVAEAISDAYVDDHLLSYQYDIESKNGADLDDFVALFGMGRFAAKRASGILTFTRTTGTQAQNSVAIPVNTQVISNGDPKMVVTTISGGWLEPYAISANVAAQAVDPGPGGNSPANSLINLGSPVSGVGLVTNIAPFTGGAPQETDAELRWRWTHTVFRNLAGTEQMYLGVALDDQRCYAANVIGASKARREQVQIVSGIGQTTVDDASSIYDSPVFVGEDIDAGDICLKDIDYTWDYTYVDPVSGLNQARVVVTPGGVSEMPDGTLFEVDYEYVPKSSRNNAGMAINNRIDIWVGGQQAATGVDSAQSAVQSVVFRTTNTFTDSSVLSNDPLTRRKFIRPDGTEPSFGSVFIPLAWGPILTVPPTLSIGGQVYAMACPGHPLGSSQVIAGENILYAYYLVHQDDAFGYTSTSMFGLEWVNTVIPGFPKVADKTVFTIGGDDNNPYLYNAMVHDIQAAVEKWRLLGTDAKVHQAKTIQLRMSFAIMYDARVNRTYVDSSVDTALSEYLTSRGFQGRVQVSDLLQVAHNVTGVDNIRFLNATDYPTFTYATRNNFAVGIQKVVQDVVVDSYVDGYGRAQDLRFGDDELPVYYGHVIVVKAENTFGSG
jgi:hypothetical protein